MRVLVIGPSEKEILKKLKENAEQNVFSFDDLLDMYNKRVPIVGEREGFTCTIPATFRIAYSIEEHPLKDGKGFKKLRHASISVPEIGKLPNPEACNMIIEELGYKNKLDGCVVHVEDRAINIIEEF